MLENEIWTCWNVATLREFQLARAFDSVGIPSYLPQYLNREKLFDNEENTVYRHRPRALFPGYLFSAPVHPDLMLKVCRLVGIRCTFRKIGHVHHTEIADLKSAENEHGYFDLLGGSNYLDELKPNQKLLINRPGVWFGREGVFSSRVDDRLTVLMQLCGRETALDFHISEVIIA